MSELSDYAEDALVDHILGTSALSAPAAVYLALHTADPTDDGSGAELPVANGYARSATVFGASSGGIASNTAAEVFTASGGDWGLITHCALWDAATAGNMLFHTPLDASETVNDGGTLTFAIGDIDVQLS